MVGGGVPDELKSQIVYIYSKSANGCPSEDQTSKRIDIRHRSAMLVLLRSGSIELGEVTQHDDPDYDENKGLDEEKDDLADAEEDEKGVPVTAWSLT